MKPLVYSKIARARGLAEAIAAARDDARLDGIREGAAEIVELLKIEHDLPATGVRLAVSRLPDDDLALRASIGGRKDMGYYLQFRGDPQQVAEMLTIVCAAAETMLPAGNFKVERER